MGVRATGSHGNMTYTSNLTSRCSKYEDSTTQQLDSTSTQLLQRLSCGLAVVYCPGLERPTARSGVQKKTPSGSPGGEPIKYTQHEAKAKREPRVVRRRLTRPTQGLDEKSTQSLPVGLALSSLRGRFVSLSFPFLKCLGWLPVSSSLSFGRTITNT